MHKQLIGLLLAFSVASSLSAQVAPAPIDFHDLISLKNFSESAVASREQKIRDKKAAKKVADYVVSPAFVVDVNAFVNRSSGPLKEYLRNYFFHCDFHKSQLQEMKECFGELDILMQDSLPLSAHAMFSYVVSDAMKKQVHSVSEGIRGLTIYSASGIIEHIEEQDGVLSRSEREKFIVLKDRWSAWYDRWNGFLLKLYLYIESRTESREQFLDMHKKDLLFSMAWKHAGPTLWFLMSKFHIARIVFGSSVHDAHYFTAQLLLRLHKNVTIQRTVLEEKIIERTRESLKLYSSVLNQVIDESLAKF